MSDTEPESPDAVSESATAVTSSPEDATGGVVQYLVGLACRMTILFGVYVLSIGPMYWQWYSGKYVNGSAYIAAFYEPLRILCIRFPWFGDWVDNYVWMWNTWG